MSSRKSRHQGDFDHFHEEILIGAALQAAVIIEGVGSLQKAMEQGWFDGLPESLLTGVIALTPVRLGGRHDQPQSEQVWNLLLGEAYEDPGLRMVQRQVQLAQADPDFHLDGADAWDHALSPSRQLDALVGRIAALADQVDG